MSRAKNRKHELERASVERKFPAFSSFGGHVLSQFIILFLLSFLGLSKRRIRPLIVSLFRRLSVRSLAQYTRVLPAELYVHLTLPSAVPLSLS